MSFLRHGDHEIRQSLARFVAFRWPHERLLLVTHCLARQLPVRGAGGLGDLPEAEGVVGVTETRLVYQLRTPHGLLLRVTAGMLGLLALLGLLYGRDARTIAYLAVGSLALWLLARGTEALGGPNGVIRFESIRAVDRREQSIEGFGRWGILHRLHLPDPS
ncbi:MAG: hypothetical protein ACRDH0_09025, partial [Actinomycetota bacterium]